MGGGAFQSLRNANFRLWACGSLVSNVGEWFQRIAQDWLVLTVLTAHNGTAVGVLMALQSAPTLLLLPFTGPAVDQHDRRALLVATQSVSALLAAGLGLLAVFGKATLWEVYGFGLLLGCVTALDGPARHAFVAELVDEADLANAVALNATVFNAARMIGPALAGLAIAAWGPGWAMIVNAASFLPVVLSLLCLRVHDPYRRRSNQRAGFLAGLRYAGARPDLRTVLLMLLVIGALGLNFPIFVSTMSVSVFHVGARKFGMVTSIMAVGSLGGSFLIARSGRPTLLRLTFGALLFGIGFSIAAVTPSVGWFGAALSIVGVAGVAFTTSTSSYLQLATDPSMRGRVLSLRTAVGVGATPIGAPLVGWVADNFGPRWAVAVGAASGFCAAALGARQWLADRRGATRANVSENTIQKFASMNNKCITQKRLPR